jgi:hypothetical protein
VDKRDQFFEAYPIADTPLHLDRWPKLVVRLQSGWNPPRNRPDGKRFGRVELESPIIYRFFFRILTFPNFSLIHLSFENMINIFS